MAAEMQALGGPSPGQTCVLILIFTVLLQTLCVTVTYMYFTNELKQMQDKFSKSGIACFLKEDDTSWDPSEEDSMDSPCWQVRWQLRQLVRKMILRTYEETIPTVQGSIFFTLIFYHQFHDCVKKLFLLLSAPTADLWLRVSAHCRFRFPLHQQLQSSEPTCGPAQHAQHGHDRHSGLLQWMKDSSTIFSTKLPPTSELYEISSKNEKALGQKINSWESSRKGHSFLNNLHLRNGELVIHQTGFYYIYSQTYFRFQEPEETLETLSKEEARKRNKQMVQYIYKYTSYPDPILLMKSARNSCWSKDSEYGLYSIYQGGIFELKENDRIFVSVTNEQLVDMDQEASFFGAFLVG
ncbi:tumor necrosis factor ligand superfamily member 10 [Tupaia chinensis]|uniref:tumor necrosis factor ligand superfamily member 10 n=1 Tax=Tupaia chinensis TaxID=246437 RepID=UPI000FFB2A4A|nr:tumor necrosis factor ligand superfamily member 10 [Tupaia chinensis]